VSGPFEYGTLPKKPSTTFVRQPYAVGAVDLSDFLNNDSHIPPSALENELADVSLETQLFMPFEMCAYTFGLLGPLNGWFFKGASVNWRKRCARCWNPNLPSLLGAKTGRLLAASQTARQTGGNSSRACCSPCSESAEVLLM